MSYGEALGIGCIVGLVSSAVSIVFTLVYINYVDTTVMTQLLDKTLEDMEKQDQPEQAFEMTKKYFSMFFYGGLIVFTLIFNFIFALLISAFTQKRNPNPVF
jgi:ABC-type antimicrobial peptide transport system permease subunit